MILEIEKQESHSRVELLLRSLFGFIYILFPHAFVLFFLTIWSGILNFITFWSIMFTGRYPQSFFEFQEKLHRWNLRVNASYLNLVDGYPKFGLDAQHEKITFSVAYPETVDRWTVLARAFFGVFYVLIPHGFALFFIGIAASFVAFLSFWAVLFTGNYPDSFFQFMVGYLRWNQRVSLYLGYMTDQYPPFSLS